MEDGVGIAGVLLQLLDGLGGRQDEELDFATSGFTLHLIHHREGAGSGADDEPPAGLRGLLPPLRAEYARIRRETSLTLSSCACALVHDRSPRHARR